MDGMTAYNTDVQATIDRCKEISGDDESLITIDILQVTDPGSVQTWDKPAVCAYTNYQRKSALKGVYIGSDALKSTKRAHPHINWRHLIIQSKKATGTSELDFDPKTTHPLIEGGKEDAKKALHAMNMSAETFLQ